MFNTLLFVGTTLDEALYYVNSTSILACMGLRFYLTFRHSLSARQVFGVVARDSTLICHSRSAPPFLSEASGSSLVLKQSTGFTACWMMTVRTIKPYL